MNVGKYKDHSVYLPKCKILMEQLSAMIREILDVSKFEKLQNGEDEEIDLSELIPQVLPPYAIIAKSKGICIETDTYEKLSICYPLPMIKKVISNLLANAVSYTPKGGSIKIYIENQNLIFENECVPIPQKDLIHIFEPFYRPEYGSSPDTGGNGLGLYIVDTILKTLLIPYTFAAIEDNSGMRFTIEF